MKEHIYGGWIAPRTVTVKSGQDTREIEVAETLFCGEVETDHITACKLADGRYYLDDDGREFVFPNRFALAEHLWDNGDITWRHWQVLYEMDGFVTLDYSALWAADAATSKPAKQLAKA